MELDNETLRRILQRASYGSWHISDKARDWFGREVGINDPFPIIEHLKENGYIKECDVNVKLNKMKIPEIKNILTKHNISLKGNKAELLTKLISIDDFQSIKLPIVVELTEKGNTTLLDLNEKIIAKSLSDYDITEQEYYNMKRQLGDNLSPDAVILSILLEKEHSEPIDNSNFSLCRNRKLQIALKFKSLNQLYQATQYFLYILYMDMCKDLCCDDIIMRDEMSEPLPYILNQLTELKSYFMDNYILACFGLPVPSRYERVTKRKFLETVKGIADN